MKFPIYMDHHATTPLDPRVLEAMMPSLTTEFGNAASQSHPLGLHAEKMVEQARSQVAHLIHAEPDEIVFTSGATESINLGIKGVMESYSEKGDYVITQITEHKAALDTCRYLERHGKKVIYLWVDKDGRISLESLAKAITEKTVLVSIMFANNEIGTIQPIQEIGKIVKQRGVLFHVDAAQAIGKIPIDVQSLGVDLLSISAHKIYGPKGCGALYVRRKNPRVCLEPLLHGGGHEQGLRSGTLNVSGIVGLGKACEIAQNEMPDEFRRVKALRDRLEFGLKREVEEVYVNGHPEERLPNNLNISFDYVDGEAILAGIQSEIAVSAGSACASALSGPSHVLRALGLSASRVHGAIRFGLGRFNTEEEVDYAVRRIAEVVKRLREMSPIYQEIKSKGKEGSA